MSTNYEHIPNLENPAPGELACTCESALWMIENWERYATPCGDLDLLDNAFEMYACCAERVAAEMESIDCDSTAILAAHEAFIPTWGAFRSLEDERRNELIRLAATGRVALMRFRARGRAARPIKSPNLPATADEAVAILHDEWATYAELAAVTSRTESGLRSLINRAKQNHQFLESDEQEIEFTRPGAPRIRLRIRAVWPLLNTKSERSQGNGKS